MFKYDEFSSEIDQKLKFTTLHPKKSHGILVNVSKHVK